MIWLWFLVVPFLIALAVLTLVDVFRRHVGGWALAAWVLFIVCVPVIGSIAYWIARPAGANAAEDAYLAQADMRRQSKQLPIDRSGY